MTEDDPDRSKPLGDARTARVAGGGDPPPWSPPCSVPRHPTVGIRRDDPALAALFVRGLTLLDEIAIIESESNELPMLSTGPDGLELRVPGEAAGRGLTCDWRWLRRAILDGRGFRTHPLVKAVGDATTVVDATAGLGDDAMLLAATGRRVIAYERHPAIWALFDDARLRAAEDPLLADVVARLELHRADAITAIRAIDFTPPDAIVIDPMFPPKRRSSALPRKAIQVLRRVVGDDPDADRLLEVAIEIARERVVIKRLDDGPPLREPVDFSIGGKTIRCDVYRGRRHRGRSASNEGEARR